MRIEARGLIYDSAVHEPSQRVAAFTSLCILHSGAVLCGFQVGPAKHAPTSTVRLCRADDGGKSWRELPARFDTSFDGVPGSLASAEMVEIESGRLLLLATWFDRSDPERPLFNPQTEGILRSKLLIASSADEGRTWSDWSCVPTPGLFGCASTGPLLQWSEATVGVPFESYKEYDDPRPGCHAAWITLSHDGGRTFRDPLLIAEDPKRRLFYWDQRLCVRAGDHAYVALFWTHDLLAKRDLAVHQLRASLDNRSGANTPVPTTIPGQIAAPLELPDGRLLAFVVDRGQPGTMTLWQSADGGRTWPADERLIVYVHDERALLSQGSTDVEFKQYWDDMAKWTFGHPAIRLLDDGCVLLAWYAGIPGSTSIHWARARVFFD